MHALVNSDDDSESEQLLGTTTLHQVEQIPSASGIESLAKCSLN
jgi:hypothetical protein